MILLGSREAIEAMCVSHWHCWVTVTYWSHLSTDFTDVTLVTTCLNRTADLDENGHIFDRLQMGESDRFPRHPLSCQLGSNLQRKKETSWDPKEKAPKLNQSWKKKMVGRKRARPAHQRLCQWSDQRSVQIWQPLKPPICHLFLLIFFWKHQELKWEYIHTAVQGMIKYVHVLHF